jgi:hypothetical protein
MQTLSSIFKSVHLHVLAKSKFLILKTLWFAVWEAAVQWRLRILRLNRFALWFAVWEVAV